jgi:conjugal transfer pilus assembly protein TraE
MNLALFRRQQRDLRAGNRWLGLAVALLAAANLWAWWQRGQQDTVVVLTPPTLTQPARVARNQADGPYQMAQGLFVAQLLGNVTPGTSELLTQALEPLLDARIYHTVKVGIAEQLRQLRDDEVTLSFAPRATYYEPATNTVFVTGRLTTAGASGQPRHSERTYELRWVFDQYRPRLVHLDAYDGPPRTQGSGPVKKEAKE